MLSPQGGSHRCPLWCLAADKEPFRGGEAPVPCLLFEPSGPLSPQPHLHPPKLNWLKAKGCKVHPLLIPVTSASLALTFPPNYGLDLRCVTASPFLLQRRLVKRFWCSKLPKSKNYCSCPKTCSKV